MRILVVARYKENGFSPFVTEQVDAIKIFGVDCRIFPIRKKGVMGYVQHFSSLRKVIREFQPDVIHAHYGLCGLFANLQRRIPVVTTYHGSDINDPKIRRISRVAIGFSRENVFVSQKLMNLAAPVKRGVVIPCGINLEDYPIVGKIEARKQMGLERDRKYVLFAGAFDNPAKNAELAQSVIGQLTGVDLLEFKGYSRAQVSLLMQAADVLLMTSLSEGSPQVIKEALTCGCPIVSVNVGDVCERVADVKGCFIAKTHEPRELTELVQEAMLFVGRTEGRKKLLADGLDNRQVAQKLIVLYNQLCGH